MGGRLPGQLRGCKTLHRVTSVSEIVAPIFRQTGIECLDWRAVTTQSENSLKAVFVAGLIGAVLLWWGR